MEVLLLSIDIDFILLDGTKLARDYTTNYI